MFVILLAWVSTQLPNYICHWATLWTQLLISFSLKKCFEFQKMGNYSLVTFREIWWPCGHKVFNFDFWRKNLKAKIEDIERNRNWRHSCVEWDAGPVIHKANNDCAYLRISRKIDHRKTFALVDLPSSAGQTFLPLAQILKPVNIIICVHYWTSRALSITLHNYVMDKQWWKWICITKHKICQRSGY